MTLNQVALIAEISSAIAIFISLIYVAIQIKDSSKAARSSATSDATQSIQSFYMELGSNRQISELWYDILTTGKSKSKHDEFQFMMMTHSAFIAFQNSFYLSQEGTLNTELRDSIGSSIIAVRDLPGFVLYWKQRKGFFNKGYVDWIEGLSHSDKLDTFELYKNT
ncbi:hypothetical protein ABXT60_05290 [Candidatus Njordibacter sp. Uisw_056]|uniref:hypothetical protein n=1 Tax=Candidatus Njordibacter sp. Uisw_056 TaxID=3230973 RepID=UPI003D524397